MTEQVEAVRATELRLSLDGQVILAGCSLSVRPGEIAAVVGESGVGKTTLVNVLAGFRTLDDGAVEILGEPVDPKDPDQGDRLRRERIGVLAQDLVLLPELSAARNVAVPLLLAGMAPGPAMSAARASLALLGLEDHADRPIAKLSRGQRQRTALARALAHDRPVLLLDEPTSSVDAATRDRVLAHIRDRANAGAAVVLTTHDHRVAAQADTVWDLIDGQLRQRPSP
jgi:putative ABC transport system ATP-binding protein